MARTARPFTEARHGARRIHRVVTDHAIAQGRLSPISVWYFRATATQTIRQHSELVARTGHALERLREWRRGVHRREPLRRPVYGRAPVGGAEDVWGEEISVLSLPGQLRGDLAGCRDERRKELEQLLDVGPVGRCGGRECRQRSAVRGLDGHADRPDAGFVLLVRDRMAPSADLRDLI